MQNAHDEEEPIGLSYPRVTDAERERRRQVALAAGAPACHGCGKPTTFDPNLVGMTCGGLWLRGWYVCTARCGREGQLASGLAEVCEAPTWTVAKGGRSVDIGTGRIRFGAIKVESGETLDVVGLMARVARLPDLERRVRQLEEEVRVGFVPPETPAAVLTWVRTLMMASGAFTLDQINQSAPSLADKVFALAREDRS